MAFYRKLSEGWRLSDGILPECLLEQPTDVYRALRADGRLPDAGRGLNAPGCEWIAAREWTYSLLLDAPGEDDERVYVELPKAAGSGRAYLNGEPIGRFESGAVRLELTGALREQGENRLEICFEPTLYERPKKRRPVPCIGLCCAPVLRAVNFVTIETTAVSSRLHGEDGIVTVETALTAHTAGKYVFRYALALDGEQAGRYEMIEKLPAARRTVRHELRVRRATALNADRPDETVYGVKFELERGGVGCDVRHMETAFRRNAPMRCAAVGEWPVSGDMLDRIKATGADGIVLSGRPENAFEKNDFLDGLTVVEDGEPIGGIGMMRAGDMRELAEGEPIWPPTGALWRLRGGCMPGEAAADVDAERFAWAARLRQAAETLDGARRMRAERRRATVRMDEDFAYFSSEALIERSGAGRPALEALRFGWRETQVFCERPDGGAVLPDQPVRLNVWALAEGLRGSVLKASVRVFRTDGGEVLKDVFPVMGGEARMAGMISLRTPPEEGLLIVRCELLDAGDRLISRADGVLPVCRGDGMRPLYRAEETRLTTRGGKTRNEGATTALSALICLLPGEETDADGVEWMNGLHSGNI